MLLFSVLKTYSWLLILQEIVTLTQCALGYQSLPLKNTTPFLQAPPLNLETAQALSPFLENSPLYIGFS